MKKIEEIIALDKKIDTVMKKVTKIDRSKEPDENNSLTLSEKSILFSKMSTLLKGCSEVEKSEFKQYLKNKIKN